MKLVLSAGRIDVISFHMTVLLFENGDMLILNLIIGTVFILSDQICD